MYERAGVSYQRVRERERVRDHVCDMKHDRKHPKLKHSYIRRIMDEYILREYTLHCRGNNPNVDHNSGSVARGARSLSLAESPAACHHCAGGEVGKE